MNKRNAAAAAAAANGGQEGSSPPTADDATGSGVFSLPSTTASERLKNPFADYDDGDEDDSGSGSDDGEVENVEGGGAGSTNNAWNRGSWWRGVVRSARGGGSGRMGHGHNQDTEVERFGDGRDDESSDEEGGRRLAGDDDVEDEEFGDFAMPEVEERVSVSGIDPARDSILVKPTAVHPTTTMLKSSTGAISPFTSLWPFSREKKGDDAEGSNTSTPAGLVPIGGITEEPVQLTREEEAMMSEDGKKIDRAVEATRRTSIEDPDDDEDVGEEIIVHRTAGVR